MSSVGRANRSSNRISMTGMASGLDTESIVQASMAGEKEKINKLLRKQKLAEWKTEQYRDISSILKSLKDEYMDSLNSQTNMRSQSMYKAYRSTCVTSNGENSQLVSATGTADGTAGKHIVSVIQKATGVSLDIALKRGIQTNTMEYIAKKCNDLDTALDADGKKPSQSFQVTIDGVSKTIKIDNDVLKSFSSPDGTDSSGNPKYKLDSANFTKEIENAISDKFGKGKVSITANGNQFTIDTTTNGGATNLIISGADFLGLSSTENNRISGSTSLSVLSTKTGGTWAQEDGKFLIKINGEEFRLAPDQTLNDLMRAVNSNTKADVTISYNEITNKIECKTKSLGEKSKIELSGIGGANTLPVVGGQDAKAIIDGVLVTRPKNEFMINGVLYNILREPTDSEKVSVSYKDINGNDIYMPMGDTEFDLWSPAPPIDKTTTKIKDEYGKDIIKPINYKDYDVIVPVDPDITIFKRNGTQISNADYALMTNTDKEELLFKKNGTVIEQAVTINDYKDKLNGEEILNIRFVDATGNTIKSESDKVDSQAKYNSLSNSEMAEVMVIYTPNATSEVSIELKIDAEKVYNNIKTFIDEYNAIVAKINGELNEKYDRKYPPLTDEEKETMSEDQVKLYETKAKQGLLRRDDVLSGIASNIRTAMYEPIKGISGGIYGIGITTSSAIEDNGKLNIDKNKLMTAITNDPDQVMNLFSKKSDTSYSRNSTVENRKTRNSENGIVERLYDIINDSISTVKNNSGSYGTLIEKAGEKDTSSETANELYKQMASYEKLIESMWDKYYEKEDALYKKYSNLETMMSKLNNQKSSLESMFS